MRVLTSLALMLGWIISTQASAQDTKPLTPVEAIKKVNEEIAVQMLVKTTKNRLEKRGEIYLDSEEDFHDEKNLGVVITKTGAAKYKEAKVDDPAVHFQDKTIRVKGTVIIKEDRPRIEVDDPKQIQIVDKDDPLGEFSWLVGGKWVAEIKTPKGEPLTVEMTCEWTGHKKALRYSVVFKTKEEVVPQYEGMYWWNPAKKEIRLLQIDRGGNVTESLVTIEGGTWTQKNSLTRMDGTKQEQRAQFVRENADTFSFKALIPKGNVWVEAVAFKYQRVRDGIADERDDATQKDLEKFQGNWQLISFERDGKKTPQEEAKKLTLTIQGNKFILRKDAEIISEGTMTLDPIKKPKELEESITTGPNKGKVFSAIYEIDDEHHKICFAAAGKGRPMGFSSLPGSGHLLQVWKRDKK